MAYEGSIGTSTTDYMDVRPYGIGGGQAEETQPVLSAEAPAIEPNALLGNISREPQLNADGMVTGLSNIASSIDMGTNIDNNGQKLFTSIGQAVVDNATEEAIRKKKEAYIANKLEQSYRTEYAKSLLGNAADLIMRGAGY